MASSQRCAKPRSLRQTYLGSSAQNRLIILDHHKSTPTEEAVTLATIITCDRDNRIPTSSTEAFIFRLPDELLAIILELATKNNTRYTSWRWWYCVYHTPSNYADIKALALVCCRFNRIALPLLYRVIRFRFPRHIVPSTKAVKTLHSTLQKYPSLSQYCRRLSIRIVDSRSESRLEDFSIVNDIASWLTKVQCFEIHGGFDECNEQTWGFLRSAVQHMREIEHLSLSREAWGLYLKPIMEHIDIPSLKKLDIHGISEAKDGATVVLEPKVSLQFISFPPRIVSVKRP
jgi:hypothetical protein